MGKGRPSLDKNPYADRILIRNFINKYGEDQFCSFLKMAVESDRSKSSLSRSLGIGFGTISRLYGAVFDVKSGRIKESVREFLLQFYGYMLSDYQGKRTSAKEESGHLYDAG
jgi:hypothetical protein